MHENRQQFTTMANIRSTYRAFRKNQMLETHPDIVTQNLWDEAWVCLFICPYFFFLKLPRKFSPTVTSTLKNLDMFLCFS